MKINVLSLESTEDDLSSVDPANVDNEVESTAETEDLESTAEVESTGEDTSEEDAADEEQAEALEAQFIVLEDLIQSWQAAGKLTPKMLHQASESLPELKITHGRYTHEQRYSLAMEGIVSKAWDLLKAFWAKIAAMWKKFLALFQKDQTGSKAPLDARHVVEAATLIEQAVQIYQRNASNVTGPNTDPSQSEDFVWKFNHHHIAHADHIYKSIAPITPGVKQYVTTAVEYLNQLDAWGREWIQNPNTEPALPASPAYLTEFMVKVKELGDWLHQIRRNEDALSKPNIETVIAALQSRNSTEAAKAEKELLDLIHTAFSFSEKRVDEIRAHEEKAESDKDEKMRSIYGEIGHQLSKIHNAVLRLTNVLSTATRFDREAAEAGSLWISSLIKIYKIHLGKGGNHELEKDVEKLGELNSALKRTYSQSMKNM
jgi:hypothetical protein